MWMLPEQWDRMDPLPEPWPVRVNGLRPFGQGRRLTSENSIGRAVFAPGDLTTIEEPDEPLLLDDPEFAMEYRTLCHNTAYLIFNPDTWSHFGSMFRGWCYWNAMIDRFCVRTVDNRIIQDVMRLDDFHLKNHLVNNLKVNFLNLAPLSK